VSAPDAIGAVVALVCWVLISAACGSGDGVETSPTGSPPSSPAAIPDRSPTELELPIRIAVTLPVFEEFARRAGLEHVEVISLIPPGADPHGYEFSASDIERIKGIDFFFVNGLGLDNRLKGVIEANRDSRARVIPFAPNILSPQGGGITAEQASDNPHLWLDPTLAYVYTEIVADELIIYDGVRQNDYDRNFEAHRDELVALQVEIQATLSAISPERRTIVTTHDSFQHFARRFELSIAGFAAAESDGAVSELEIQRLAGLVAERQAPAVFAEYGYGMAAMREVADRAGVPLCTLYTDILGDGMDYQSMMRANAAELVRCLSG